MSFLKKEIKRIGYLAKPLKPPSNLYETTYSPPQFSPTVTPFKKRRRMSKSPVEYFYDEPYTDLMKKMEKEEVQQQTENAMRLLLEEQRSQEIARRIEEERGANPELNNQLVHAFELERAARTDESVAKGLAKMKGEASLVNEAKKRILNDPRNSWLQFDSPNQMVPEAKQVIKHSSLLDADYKKELLDGTKSPDEIVAHAITLKAAPYVASYGDIKILTDLLQDKLKIKLSPNETRFHQINELLQETFGLEFTSFMDFVEFMKQELARQQRERQRKIAEDKAEDKPVQKGLSRYIPTHLVASETVAPKIYPRNPPSTILRVGEPARLANPIYIPTQKKKILKPSPSRIEGYVPSSLPAAETTHLNQSGSIRLPISKSVGMRRPYSTTGLTSVSVVPLDDGDSEEENEDSVRDDEDHEEDEDRIEIDDYDEVQYPQLRYIQDAYTIMLADDDRAKKMDNPYIHYVYDDENVLSHIASFPEEQQRRFLEDLIFKSPFFVDRYKTDKSPVEAYAKIHEEPLNELKRLAMIDQRFMRGATNDWAHTILNAVSNFYLDPDGKISSKYRKLRGARKTAEALEILSNAFNKTFMSWNDVRKFITEKIGYKYTVSRLAKIAGITSIEALKFIADVANPLTLFF